MLKQYLHLNTVGDGTRTHFPPFRYQILNENNCDAKQDISAVLWWLRPLLGHRYPCKKKSSSASHLSARRWFREVRVPPRWEISGVPSRTSPVYKNAEKMAQLIQKQCCLLVTCRMESDATAFEWDDTGGPVRSWELFGVSSQTSHHHRATILLRKKRKKVMIAAAAFARKKLISSISIYIPLWYYFRFFVIEKCVHGAISYQKVPAKSDEQQ